MERICCIIGHRKINESDSLKKKISKTILKMVCIEKIYTFLFGGPGSFNDICWTTVTNLQQRYPNIQRVYVRASSPEISEQYNAYLLESYEKTFFPKEILNAGKLSYLKRNQIMIDLSDTILFYFRKKDELYNHKQSGTALAYHYAQKKKKRIINIYE